MDEYSSCELEIWKGDWGLPSVNVECLKILTFAKCNGLNVKINETNNPFRSPNGKLPVLRTGNRTICDVDSIVSFLSSEKLNSTFTLDSKQMSECMAYGHLVEENMYPAIQYMCWVHQQNFNEIVRPWYAKNIPFPFNYYYPGKLEKDAKALVDSLYPNNDEQTTENEIYSKAQKCMTTLSVRLGTSDYFYGTEPSMLDVIVYAHLAPVLRTPLTTSSLKNHLKQCDNLEKLVNRISQKYFSISLQEYERTKLNDSKQPNASQTENDFPHKRRDQILAGVFATLAMTTYALSTGIVEVQEDDSDPEGGGYEFDDDEND